jgi:hypothetical protein
MDYVLGRGKLYFDRFAANTKVATGIERYFGNTTELNFSLSSEKLDHFSSESGVRVKDDSVTLQTDSTGNFICDNISVDNLALFFLGDASTVTVTGATLVADTANNVVKGSYFQIGTSSGNPAGTRDISTVVVKKGVTTINTDQYVLDTALARIQWAEDADEFSDGDDLTLTYTQVAHTRDRVVSKSESIQGAMRFIADNPKGSNRDYFIPYCEISPDGDFALKGDDWQQLGFTIEILKLDEDTERLYIEGRAVA